MILSFSVIRDPIDFEELSFFVTIIATLYLESCCQRLALYDEVRRANLSHNSSSRRAQRIIKPKHKLIAEHFHAGSADDQFDVSVCNMYMICHHFRGKPQCFILL